MIFIVKATRKDPEMECRYHLDFATKEEAEAEFKRLMPAYEITKTKQQELPIKEEGEVVK